MCVRGSGQHLAQRKQIGDESSFGGGLQSAPLSALDGAASSYLPVSLRTLSLLPLSLSLLCLPLLLFRSFLDDAGGEG